MDTQSSKIKSILTLLLQANYYEEMDACPALAVPEFTASVPELLDNTDAAREVAESYIRTNEGSIYVDIVVGLDCITLAIGHMVCRFLRKTLLGRILVSQVF